MSRLYLFVTLSILPATVLAQAPRDTVELSEIVVTATRVPSAAVTASTTVISGAALREQGYTHLADALAAVVPGVAVARTGSFGGATSLFLRGGQSGYTRVLLDGVPLNQPGGAFDFGSLTTAGIERVEVVRGPSSVLYGTDAVTGVIQIFTRRGAGAPRLSADASGGTYGTLSLGTGLTGGTGGASYGFHVSREQTNGIYAFNNQFHDTRLSGAVKLTPDARTDALITLHYADDVYHYPTESGGQVIDRNAFHFTRRYTVALDAGRRLTPAAEWRVQLNAYTTDGGTDDQPDGPADSLGFFAYRGLQTIERRSADTRLNLSLARLGTVTLGGQVEQERERSLDQSESEFGPSNSLFDEDRHNGAGYAQLVGSSARLTWNVSGRLDHNGAFGDFGTWRAGAAVRILPGLRVRSNIGTAFREPTFFENYATGFVRGNAALKPERTTSWEVGLEHTLPNRAGQLTAIWFDQRFRNMIDFTFAPPQPNDPNYFNIAAARSRGAELEASLRLGPVTASGQYTWLHARVLDGGFDSTAYGLFLQDSALIRRPSHTGSAGLALAAGDRATARIRVSYVGERADVDYANAVRVRLPAYATTDVSAEVTALRRNDVSFKVRLSVSNLLGQSYQAVLGYRAPGRTILAGAGVEF